MFFATLVKYYKKPVSVKQVLFYACKKWYNYKLKKRVLDEQEYVTLLQKDYNRPVEEFAPSELRRIINDVQRTDR